MLNLNCKQGVLWFSLLSMVWTTPTWAQFRGQGFFGGNGRPFGQGGGQGANQGPFQPNNRLLGQPGQRPFPQLMPPQGNRQLPIQNQGQQQVVKRPQFPLQNSKIGQRLPGLGGQNGAGNPLPQARPGIIPRPLSKLRPDLNPGAKGDNQLAKKLPIGGNQPRRPVLPDLRKQAGKGVDPFLANRRPLANPKPNRRPTDLKKFGIDFKPAQKLDQKRNGPQRADNVARRFHLLNENRPANGPRLAKGIENKMEGVLTGAIRANDPKIIQNFRRGRADFADRLVADGAIRRFRANRATAADRDLLQQFGGIDQLIALASGFVVLPDFCTDAGVIDPIDDGGCMLASMLEPVQYLDDESDLYDELADSDASDDEELLADHQVLLIHPYAEEAGLDFSIDGGVQSISAGTKSAFLLPHGEKGEIKFATGSGATTRYTLTAGETYEFYDKDGFWDLRKKKLMDDLPHNVPPRNLVNNEAAPAETVPAVAKAEGAAQVVAAKVETTAVERTEPNTNSTKPGDEETDDLADIPADAAAVADQSDVAAAPPVVRKVVGRFAVLNPLENEVELRFRVNGQGRSLAPGKVAILNVIGNATTVAFSNGEQEALVERSVAVGKAYEFWNNDGVWDLREKEIPQQRIAANAN